MNTRNSGESRVHNWRQGGYLCWDVEMDEIKNTGACETKIASPRILAKIGEVDVAVLVDSVSEVTVISENFCRTLHDRSFLLNIISVFNIIFFL